MNDDQLANYVRPADQKYDSYTWGNVKGINTDGSYQVQLNASSTTTKCIACCSAKIGDRVHVCIQADGKCVADGRLGGDLSLYDTGWKQLISNDKVWFRARRVGKYVTLIAWSYQYKTFTAGQYVSFWTDLPEEYRPSIDIPFTCRESDKYDGGFVRSNGAIEVYANTTNDYCTFFVTYPVDADEWGKPGDVPPVDPTPIAYSNVDYTDYIPGKIFPYAGKDTPNGCLLCDGSEVSRTTYWELFSVIGTTYGAGDGVTTFNLPDLKQRVVIGESENYAFGKTGGERNHKLTVSEMPSHKHRWESNWSFTGWSGTSPMGFLTVNWNSDVIANGGGFEADTYTENGRTVNLVKAEGGGGYHNNMQPYIVMRYYITTGKGEIIDGVHPADYIIECGETNGWIWAKYASGKATCSGTFTFNNYSSWVAWGGVYETDKTFTPPAYPFAFTKTPVLHISAKSTIGTLSVEYFGLGSERQAPAIQATRGSSSNSTPAISFDIYVEGKHSDTLASTAVATYDVEDRIIDRGIEGRWNWVKYASGWTECEYRYSYKIPYNSWSESSTYPDMYYASSESCPGNVSYPFEFESAPIEIITPNGEANGLFYESFLNNKMTNTTTTSGSYQLYRGSMSNAAEVTYSYSLRVAGWIKDAAWKGTNSVSQGDWVESTETYTNGVNEDWIIRKWHSGYCEAQSTRFEVTGIDMSKQYGSLYYAEYTNWGIPPVFTKVYSISIEDHTGGGLVSVKTFNINAAKHIYSVYIFDSISQTNYDRSFAGKIVGSWK